MPDEFYDKQADVNEVGNAVKAYIGLVLVDEIAQYLEQTKELLLTDSASKMLQEVAESARKDGSDAEINNLDIHQRLLERARVLGVQKAVQDEKHHQNEVAKSVAAFMSSGVDTIREVWEEHRHILRTREALRFTQRLVEQVEKSHRNENPMYHRSRTLMIRFLQDARERGIDYAEEQFHIAFAELMMEMVNNLRKNGTI